MTKTENLIIKRPIVSCDWLFEHLKAPNLIVLDASMPMAGVDVKEQKDSDGQIENARWLDIKNDFSEAGARFPNTMLSAEKFTEAARNLGINKDSAIVVYDNVGIYSSPRVWWMFKAMGHKNIAVLDGGLQAWKAHNYPLYKNASSIIDKGNFKAQYDPIYFKDHHQVLKSLRAKEGLILDARSAPRFKGLEEEPRKGLRSGHIPGSQNLPYSLLLNGATMKPLKELTSLFKELNKDGEAMMFSCGSGITACILALGAEAAGHNKLSVYDGSWTEWGSLAELPIEK